MVVGIRELIAFVWYAGIENEIHFFPDQPGYMSVGQLGRITFELAGDGFNAQLVNLTGGLGGQHGLEFQVSEKYSPEGIVFIHIQDTGDSHRSPDSFFVI